ncbi:MAG TPA: hypothetical protein VFF65_05155 [Phycisphaerales bacterium]|nr:hypothetical protein [Phycisphaerales bacterium]
MPSADAYTDLAREIADPHWMHAGQVNSTEGPAVDLARWGEELGGSSVPALRDAGRELLAGWENAKQASARVQGVVDAAGENLDAVLEGVSRGDYTVQREQVIVTTDRHGQTQARTETYTEDASALPLIGSAALYGWVKLNAPAAAQRQALLHMEAARCRAWTAVMRDIGEFYAEAPAAEGLVQLELTLDPDGGCSLSAVNTSGRTLTRVTLAVELVHFTSSPYPAVFRFHFLDTWGPRERAHFSPEFVPNVGSPPLREGRSTIMNPNTSPDPAVRRLAGMGGVTGVKWRVWSDEGIAPDEEIAISDAAALAARWELDCVYRMTRTQRGDPDRLDPRTGRRLPPPGGWDPEPAVPPARPETTEAPPRARAFAERVLTLAAPDSVEAQEAKLFLRSPHQALRAHRQKTLEAFMAAIPAQAEFDGQWKLAPGALGGGPAINRNPNPQPDTGRFTMRVLSSIPRVGKATVVLTDPDEPRRQRRLSGEVLVEFNELVLRLTPPGEERPGRRAPSNPPEQDFYEGIYDLRLSLVGEDFVGHLGPAAYTQAGYEVTLARVDARKGD